MGNGTPLCIEVFAQIDPLHLVNRDTVSGCVRAGLFVGHHHILYAIVRRLRQGCSKIECAEKNALCIIA